jgi:hypothetical protein
VKIMFYAIEPPSTWSHVRSVQGCQFPHSPFPPLYIRRVATQEHDSQTVGACITFRSLLEDSWKADLIMYLLTWSDTTRTSTVKTDTYAIYKCDRSTLRWKKGPRYVEHICRHRAFSSYRWHERRGYENSEVWTPPYVLKGSVERK